MNTGSILDKKILINLGFTKDNEDDEESISSFKPLNKLHKLDRVLLSGPKPFVDYYLDIMKGSKDFLQQQIGKQTISLD